MGQCYGLTKKMERCKRTGAWKLYCPDHKSQWINWLFTLVFTVLAGTASILSYLGITPASICPLNTKDCLDGSIDITQVNYGNLKLKDCKKLDPKNYSTEAAGSNHKDKLILKWNIDDSKNNSSAICHCYIQKLK